VVLGTSALARAEVRPRVAVLEVSISGTAAPELRTQLERGLGAGLVAGGFEVVTRDAVNARLRGQPELVGCTTTACLERIGGLLGVERFVRAKVEAQGAAYSVKLELIAGGRVTRGVERACGVCTVSEARDLLEEAGAELGPRNPSQIAVVVKTEPPGLAVTIDGAAQGRAPLELSLAAGRHVFRVVQDGRESGEQAVDVAPTADGKPLAVIVRAELPAAAAPPLVPAGPLDERPRWAIWKVAAVGAGGAFLLTGILLFAIDGNQVDCADARPCRLLRETTGLAVGSTIVGVGLLGLGGWMFYDDLTHESRSQAAVVPQPGGAVFVWRGSF
jgi:PEGA domain